MKRSKSERSKKSYIQRTADIVAHAPTNSTRASRREFIHFIAWLFGTTLGHWAIVLAIGFVLIFGCAFFWSLTGGNERCDSSFNGSFWASYTYLVDIGTQTGLRPDESYEVRFVAVVISLLGFVYSLTLLGMVVDGIRDILNIMKQHYSMIHVNNHCLILGWGEKTLFLIHELLAEQKDSVLPPRSCLRCGRRQKRTIVILSELSEYAMSEKVMNHFRFWAVDVSHVNIRYATGNPTNRTDLRKVSASLADDILVMCLGQGGKVSDQEAIQTLLALGALPGGVSGDVWVEMHDKNVSSVVSTLLPAADGIIARHSVTRMALLRSLVPSVGFAYMELASFRRGSQICVVDAPKELIGCRFIDACYQFQNAILLGVTDANNRMLKEDSASPGFMPGADYLLKEGNQLVMISSNIMSASKLRRATDKPPLQKRSPLERTYKAPQLLRDDGQLWLGPAAEKKMIVLMIGCPDDFPEMLKIIDLFLASGSEVHILSDQTLAWRESCLNQHGSPPFERLLVRHYVGSTTNKSELSRLPLGTASCALILAERLSDDEEPISSDSRSLTTVICLKNLLDAGALPVHHSSVSVMTGVTTATGVTIGSGKKSRGKKCKLVTELLDPKSEQVLHQNNSVRATGSFIYSSQLETGVFAMAVADKHGFNVLRRVSNATSGAGVLTAAKVGDFIDDHESLCFWELHDRIFQSCNGILVGWRQMSARYPLMNPPNKFAPEEWFADSGDEFIIFRKGDEMGSLQACPVEPEPPVELLTEIFDVGAAAKGKTDADVTHLPGTPDLLEAEFPVAVDAGGPAPLEMEV